MTPIRPEKMLLVERGPRGPVVSPERGHRDSTRLAWAPGVTTVAVSFWRTLGANSIWRALCELNQEQTTS